MFIIARVGRFNGGKDKVEEKEEETVEPYAVHEMLSDPQRVSILKILNRKGEMTFTELMKYVDLPSGRLAFQLSKLEPLLSKTEEKKYRLSFLGKDSLQVLGLSEALLQRPDEHIYPGNLIVRKASLDDANAIADTQRSWREKWYKFKMGKIFEVPVANLNREEIEMQLGTLSTADAVKEYITRTYEVSHGHEGPFYVVSAGGRVVGFFVFWWGCVFEPQPWGKRAPFHIQVHKEYVNLDAVRALMQTALEVARKLNADQVEIMQFLNPPEIENIVREALKEYRNIVKVEYVRLRAHVEDIPLEHQAVIQKGTENALLYLRLARNRSITYSWQPSASAVKDYPIEPEEGNMLITVDGKTCALMLFKDEPFLDEADLELYLEPKDWTDKAFVQEAAKAGIDVARKMGHKKATILVEKQLEPWFKEMGFREWEPQTDYEKIVERIRYGTNYLLRLQ